MRNWCSKMVPYKGCCVDKEHTILLVPHRKLRRSFKSIYSLLTFGFGPQGVPSFVEGRGPRPMWVYPHVLTRTHTHTRARAAAAIRPAGRPCRAEPSRVVVVGVGVGVGPSPGVSTKRKILLFGPRNFQLLRKTSWNFFTNKM